MDRYKLPINNNTIEVVAYMLPPGGGARVRRRAFEEGHEPTRHVEFPSVFDASEGVLRWG